MSILKTQRIKTNFTKQITLNTVGISAIFEWLSNGYKDFMQCPTLGLFYGTLFWAMSYGIWSVLNAQSAMHDVSAPLLAMIILALGPISAMGLYSASQKIHNGEKISISSIHHVVGAAFTAKGSYPSLFLSLFLLILAIGWMIFTPLIYAVFHSGSLHIVGDSQNIIHSIIASILSGENIPYLIVYGIFTAILAWFAFMISWFSFPMVLDQDVDPFTAAIASLQTANANKLVMIVWIPIVAVLVILALVLPYFLGLIFIIPLLAHATWHAYKSLIGKMQDIV